MFVRIKNLSTEKMRLSDFKFVQESVLEFLLKMTYSKLNSETKSRHWPGLKRGNGGNVGNSGNAKKRKLAGTIDSSI